MEEGEVVVGWFGNCDESESSNVLFLQVGSWQEKTVGIACERSEGRGFFEAFGVSKLTCLAYNPEHGLPPHVRLASGLILEMCCRLIR